jgi:SAM-dependent methyltransferase
VIACEVLEHVPDAQAFLLNIRRHLAPDGIAFVTTPNRAVFSLGKEPSPVNREHIRELLFEEFADALGPYFSRIEIWGQRFTRTELLDAWKLDVQGKIAQMSAGTRWHTPVPLRERLLRFSPVARAYQVPFLQKAWKSLRWDIKERFDRKRAIARRQYGFADFEFSRQLADALWFCAVLKA